MSERERHDPRQRRGTKSRPTGHRSTRRREASSKPAVTRARTLRPADQPRVTTAASAAAPPASAAALAAALAATLAVAFAAALAASRRYSYSEKHPPDPTPDTLPLLTLLIGLPNSQGTTPPPLREPNTCTHADMQTTDAATLAAHASTSHARGSVGPHLPRHTGSPSNTGYDQVPAHAGAA